MNNTNFKNFFKKVWDNSNILIDADNFNLKILTAILFLGRHQIELGEEITFNLNQIRKLLGLEGSIYTYCRIENAIFYFKINFYKCKLKNNRERIAHAIKAFEKPMNDIYFNKEWRVEIDSVLREQIIQLYFHDSFNENDNPFIYELINSDKILFPNYFFLNYHSLSDGSVKLYFAMKLQAKLTRKDEWEIDEISEFTGIGKSTSYRIIKNLIQFDLVRKHAGSRRTQKKAIYIINKNLKFNNGYTPFEIKTIKNMLNNAEKKLTDGEIKLYSYLYYLTDGKGEIKKSQAEIGRLIGRERNTISELTDILHEKGYIIKETYIDGNQTRCRYII
ncbi:MAG TPA: hypothetical protein GXX36_06695 [Clostridiaceae bacterium]|nr:hypothetical protein [Clostridiaceae bacterium]